MFPGRGVETFAPRGSVPLTPSPRAAAPLHLCSNNDPRLRADRKGQAGRSGRSRRRSTIRQAARFLLPLFVFDAGRGSESLREPRMRGVRFGEDAAKVGSLLTAYRRTVSLSFGWSSHPHMGRVKTSSPGLSLGQFPILESLFMHKCKNLT